MILFLRNHDNQTLVDIEFYSNLLLNQSTSQRKILCIKTFTFLNDINDWLNETFFNNSDQNTTSKYTEALNELRYILDQLGKPFNLHRVED